MPHREPPATASRPTIEIRSIDRAKAAFLPHASRATRIGVACGLAAALLLLARHVYVYRFLCDDAFISFRYARNLALGHGLVFNPGFEHVEGYSNFLWVLLNSGLYRLGVSPETGSLALSWAATLALWLLVVVFALREPLERGREWTALVAPMFLAANRSFAVWASSGLETRLFELLVVAGGLSLIREVENDPAPGWRRLSPWLFALATLTRPDGLLISATAFSAAGFALARRGRFEARRFLLWLLPYALLVGGHFAFRLAYYGSWLPNTYYAKVGGRMWWSAGADYFAAFVLEYSAWLWLPFIAIGVARLIREGRSFTPFLFAAIIVPHALYVAAIGGDHFEYRPLDLYLPFLFLLVGAGTRALLTAAPPAPAKSRRGRARDLPAFPRVSLGRNVAVAGSLAIVLLAGVELPWQSHAQFPARYLPGFPGGLTAEPERVGFMAPERNLLFRIPGLRAAAKRHLELLRSLSLRFVGLRQEEHARFLATVAPEGRELRALVQRGLLPRDTHIATGSVGAIPYHSDLRTLDRLGLTDSVVARAAPQQRRMMAHDRSASFAYGHERGVDLWAAHDVHFLWPPTSIQPLKLIQQRAPFYAAQIDSGTILLVMLPQGLERTAARFPNLHFIAGDSASFLAPYFERGIAALRDSLRLEPHNDVLERQLAYFLLRHDEPAAALPSYARILARYPDDPEMMFEMGVCRARLGQLQEARAQLERSHALALERGDPALARRIQSVTYALLSQP